MHGVYYSQLTRRNSHIHVSLRDKSGRNIFAASDEEQKNGGRTGAKYPDFKYVSEECEMFIAGVLDGLADGNYSLLPTHCARLTPIFCDFISYADGLLLPPCCQAEMLTSFNALRSSFQP